MTRTGAALVLVLVLLAGRILAAQGEPQAAPPAAVTQSEALDRSLRNIEGLLKEVDGKVVEIRGAVLAPVAEDSTDGMFGIERILSDQVSNVVWAIITWFWQFIGFRKGDATILGMVFATVGNVLSLYWAYLRYGPGPGQGEPPLWVKRLVIAYFVFGALAIT